MTGPGDPDVASDVARPTNHDQQTVAVGGGGPLEHREDGADGLGATHQQAEAVAGGQRHDDPLEAEVEPQPRLPDRDHRARTQRRLDHRHAIDRGAVAAAQVARDQAAARIDAQLEVEARHRPVGEQDVARAVRADHDLVGRRRVIEAQIGAGGDRDAKALHQQRAAATDRDGLLVGGSQSIRAIFAVLERAAASDATVLINGETGTGKSLAAESIHVESARKDGAFVVVDCGALTVGVVTKPFGFEGKKRLRNADDGISRLEAAVDTLIVIPNNRLLALAGAQMSMVDAFRRADSILLNAVQGISDLMTVPGLINVDFADVRTIMNNMGRALMGAGVGSGKRRATEAAEMAISSPLLEDVSIEGATGILINITGGPDLTLHEVNEASSLIQKAAHEDANIIFGSVIDPNLTEEIRITVIATGFDRMGKAVVPEASVPQPMRARTSQQVTLPYDNASVTTREYPATLVPPARKASGEIKSPAMVVEDADVDVSWSDDMTPVERALSELGSIEPVPEAEMSVRVAMGSGPSSADAVVASATLPERSKRGLPRPSLKGILGDEVENELDVPTFIRRHSASQPG